MLHIARVRMLALLFVLSCNVAVAFPVPAPVGPNCRVSDAARFRAIADSARARNDFAGAAAWYEAAARSTGGCSDPRDRMLHARSLVQAGAAVAETGDYLRALSLEHEAQSRLRSIAAADRRDGTAARTYLDVVDDLVSAINTVAAASM